MNSIRPPVPPKDRDTLFLRFISAELKRQFKAMCARRGKSMVQVIEQLMQDEVDKFIYKPRRHRRRK